MSEVCGMKVEELIKLKDKVNDELRKDVKYSFWFVDIDGESGLALLDASSVSLSYTAYNKMQFKGGQIKSSHEASYEKLTQFYENIEYYTNWLRLARLIKYREFRFDLNEWCITVHRGTETMQMYADGETYKAVVTKVGVEEVSYGLNYGEAREAMTHFLTKSQYV